ncbi:FKBP12-associated protein [Agyrium rufum]|nr:FKBP12-associated protein [Agyrium rufum]
MLITCPCQHIKQEVRCNASKASEGNSTKTLKCDEECARLERNRRLALALNIDPEAHKDDHIPYSTETLNMFATNVKWAQTQEREFRVFATDEKEKRLRFKPMPPQQRSFIHSLAEDFGLDSESLDPEPHRHVFILKTPRFVMAPMKTMAECLRIRQANAAPVSVTTTSLSSDRKAKNFEPFNAFLLSGPRFGLTIDELRIDISTILANAPGLKFDISFLPSEQIVLKALPASPSTTISSAAIESTLKTLMPSLTTYVNCQKLASTVYLCTLDSSLNVLRQQDDADAPGSGWSQVAAKAAVGPRAAPRLSSIGGKSQFTVLGRAVSERKRREKEEKERREREGSVVDDWEEEVRKEEERERREAGEHSDPNDGHEGQDSTAAADGDADIPVKDVEESGESDPTVLDEQPAINEVQEPAAAAS